MGGRAGPARVYLVCNTGPGGQPAGWAIPAATDTAFEHTLNVKKSGSWLSKKTTTTEHSEQSLQAATTRIDAQDIQLQSGGDLDLYGARLNAGSEARSISPWSALTSASPASSASCR